MKAALQAHYSDKPASGSRRLHLPNELGNSRPGRVLLHAMCLLQHPGRARWHWKGILREFAIS